MDKLGPDERAGAKGRGPRKAEMTMQSAYEPNQCIWVKRLSEIGLELENAGEGR